MHTSQLLRWGQHDITILVEKPVVVSEKQVAALKLADLKVNVWVAMEYRYIPAINKLLQLLPEVGPIKKVTICENRYPFCPRYKNGTKTLANQSLLDSTKDIFRLITSQEMDSCVSKVHRGLLWDHYGYIDQDETEIDPIVPIIDSAYVLLDFTPRDVDTKGDTVEPQKLRRRIVQQSTLGCLELCMFAEGSRHQEEVIVTGMKGRVEAYLPDNKVFLYHRPTPSGLWKDKSKPPPNESFSEDVFDCTDLRQVYDFANDIPKMHSGYHYCSTAIEWKYLIDTIKNCKEGGPFYPQVSLDDGIKVILEVLNLWLFPKILALLTLRIHGKAVEMGIASTKNNPTSVNRGAAFHLCLPIV
ncbi:hypothetical protein ACHAWF_002384, partial [Thalassiosira exigua]